MSFNSASNYLKITKWTQDRIERYGSAVHDMEYVNLGKTGLKVSRICLGCMSYGVPPAGELRPGSQAWSLNEEESQPFFRQALELGINFFDTANVYAQGSSEEFLG